MFYRKLMLHKQFLNCSLLNRINNNLNVSVCWKWNESFQQNNEFDASTSKKDLQSVLDVESNLFENGMHKPVVNSRELLRKYQINADMKNFRKSNTRKRNNRDNTKVEVEWSKEPEKITKRRVPSEPIIVNDTNLGIQYTKLNHNDKLLRQLFTAIKSKKQNDKDKRIIIEGRRLILEAIDCGFNLETLIFSQKDQMFLIKNEIQKLNSTEIYKTPHHDLKMWSSLVTCPGLIGIFKHPTKTFKTVKKPKNILPITVICDNVREPNNLGSIIRVCAAVPCHEVIILKGCCDPWETKALRGGCGGQFRIAIKDDICWDHVHEILPQKFSLFIAENNLEKIKGLNTAVNWKIDNYSDISLSNDHNVVIIGGETHGISEDGYRLLKQNTGSIVHVPLAEGVESLNTASALSIILFELRRNFQNGSLLRNELIVAERN